MAERRELEVFYGPDYTGTLRLAPPGGKTRSTQQLNKVLPTEPWSEHVVALMKHGQALTEWAQTEFGSSSVTATRISRFIRTRNRRELSTLTELEVHKFKRKARELGVTVQI